MAKQRRKIPIPGGYATGRALGRGALGESILATKRGGGEGRVFKILDHPDWLDEIPLLRIPGVWIGGKSPPGETAWIWSDPVSEGSLRAAMDRGTLPAREFVSILIRALENLERVHASGAVHGGLKPEDILLPAREGVVISDFGHLSLLRARDPDAASAYIFGQVVSRDLRAPFTYLPPEAIDTPVAEPHADIYAIGAILREGLEGRGDRPPIPDRLREAIRALAAPAPNRCPDAKAAREILLGVGEERWEEIPLIGDSPAESASGSEWSEDAVSFTGIPGKPVPAEVTVPAEIPEFTIGDSPASSSPRSQAPSDGGKDEDDPPPMDPAEAVQFLESMKKKTPPEEGAKGGSGEAPKGSYGLVVMGVSGGGKRETIANLIAPLMKLSPKEALEKAAEPVISVLRDVSRLEAEKTFKRFKEARLSARITTRLKKKD